jgi:hypothetical protein
MVEVNYLAILVSAALAVVIGGLWYGPVFGKLWMSLVGITPESMKSMKMTPLAAMVGGFIGALLTAFVLSHHIVFAGVFLGMSGVELALMSAFFIWLGFYVPVTAGSLLWEGKSWKLFALNASYYLVVLLVNALLLSLWK